MAARENLLLATLCLAIALPARAQLAAPRLVEEDDDGAEEAPPPPRSSQAPPVRVGPGAARERDAGPSAPEGGASAVAADHAAPATSAAQPAAGDATGARAPPAAADLARRIVPVQATFATLMELWSERRSALRESDPPRAEAAKNALLTARRELGIANLFTLSAVEIRAAHRALAANLVGDAVSHARTAVELAPDLPDAHLALARALLSEAPWSPGAALSALGHAFAAGAREPHGARALYADVLAAGLAAAFVAALATIFVLVLRRLRLFLHDFTHLPLLRGTARAQAAFLAAVVLALPIALGLGPVAAVLVALLAVWLYLGAAERIAATLAVAALLALPLAVGAVVRTAAWTGTLAEAVDDLEHGAVPPNDAAGMTARFADAPAPAAVYAALGRYEKRRGNLDAALRLYERAAAADPQAGEVQVNLGNVHFLRGDLEAAKAAYLAATDRAAGDLVVLGAAHYDLSKLYLRTSDMPQSAAAREKAEREAGEFLRRNGSDEDFSANRYLVDVPVPDEKIRALATSDGTARAMTAWAERRLAGNLPRALWPWGPVAWVVLLWTLALLAPRLRPSCTCPRCGGAACPRCDGGAGELCRQCTNVFVHKGLVDARDRLRKEAQVRRHARAVRLATRVLSVVGAGAGQVFHGAVVRGALLLLGTLFAGFVVSSWRGVLPPPQPSPHILALKLLVGAPIGIGLWALAVRDAFRRTQ